jgi:hypothetical protein
MGNKLFFIGIDDGPSIEEFPKALKSEWKEKWRFYVFSYL